jgi:hypothetical protein
LVFAVLREVLPHHPSIKFGWGILESVPSQRLEEDTKSHTHVILLSESSD